MLKKISPGGVQLEILDENLSEKWKNYLWQGVLAGGTLLLITWILSDFFDLVLIAAAGSTTFVVFALPHTKTANPRSVIGGHALCVFAGLICYPLGVPGWGAAVALGFILMVITNSEHPPAAGTALALADSPSISGAIFILVVAFSLSVVRLALISKLEDLAG